MYRPENSCLPLFALIAWKLWKKQLTEKECNILHFITYALPLTIKAAMLSSKPEQSVVRFQRRSEDKYTTVKAVRPARIRSCRKLFSIKQLINIAKHLRDSRKKEKLLEQIFLEHEQLNQYQLLVWPSIQLAEHKSSSNAKNARG